MPGVEALRTAEEAPQARPLTEELASVALLGSPAGRFFVALVALLAYVGASLPVLLLFASGELGLVEAANVELIAKEIVATLVGSIGLIAAAPITTALAAVMALRVPVRALGEDAHLHAH